MLFQLVSTRVDLSTLIAADSLVNGVNVIIQRLLRCASRDMAAVDRRGSLRAATIFASASRKEEQSGILLFPDKIPEGIINTIRR